MSSVTSKLKALFGFDENSSGHLAREVEQVTRKQIVYEWPHAIKAAGVANPATRMEAQTASLSNSQPIGIRPIYSATEPCIVKEMTFAQIVSSTVTATFTMCWTLIVNKRGGGDGTLSSTYSVTAFVGGLTSATGTSHSFTGSYSHIRQNVAYAPNKLCLSKSAAKVRL